MGFLGYAAKRTANFWIIEPILLVVLIPLLPLVFIAGSVCQMKLDYDKKNKK